MDSKLKAKIYDWFSEGNDEKIIEELSKLEELDYEEACFLARSYNNIGADFISKSYDCTESEKIIKQEEGMNYLKKGEELLLSVKREGEKDDNWYHRLGYCYHNMNRIEEAIPLFEKALEINVEDYDSLYHLGLCYYDVSKIEEAKKCFEDYLKARPEDEYIRDTLSECIDILNGNSEDDNGDTTEYNDEYALRSLCNILKDRNAKIEKNTVFIPEFNLRIYPHVDSVDNRGTIMYYNISNPDWDTSMFECSVGIGKNRKKSFGTAEGSFVLGMLQDIFNMFENHPSSKAESDFNYVRHKWNLYFGNIVHIGNPPKTEPNYLWDMIKEDVLKRIGNQKICYIKIYAAKSGDYITGECRINDIAIEEIGAKIYNYAKEWDADEFSSKKQFFFLVQDKDTYKSYPYTEEEIKYIVFETIELFKECVKNNNYDNYLHLLIEKFEDGYLAEELYSFIPEMCAENAFQNITYPDMITVNQNEKNKEYYKTQIASYYSIWRALNKADNDLLNNKTFGELVSVSSVYGAICNAKEKGADLAKDGGTIRVSYGFSDEYKMR